MTFSSILERVVSGEDLSREEANATMRALMSGDLHDAQIGGLLIGLQAKGVKAAELAGFAEVMRENAASLSHSYETLVDTCGTGGGPATFNLSTGAAILAASAGAKVAKHGNRAVTSKCGSADVLEALGVGLGSDPEQLLGSLEKIGIAFLYAPNHHPAMRHVGPSRKALGVRTVFNQLGPLANPAGAKRQLVGVYEESLLIPMAEALLQLGAERAFVVHSEEGMDEISPCGKTSVAVVEDGVVSRTEFTPATFRLNPIGWESLSPASDAQSNADILIVALLDPTTMRSRALIPNAAAALYLSGVASSLEQGAELALSAIESGKAKSTLDELVKWTS